MPKSSNQYSNVRTSKHWTIIGPMLVHHLRCWPNIGSAIVQGLVFAGAKLVIPTDLWIVVREFSKVWDSKLVYIYHIHQLYQTIVYTANRWRWINVGLTLVQRRRRWTSVKPTLSQRLVSAGIVYWKLANCSVWRNVAGAFDIGFD